MKQIIPAEAPMNATPQTLIPQETQDLNAQMKALQQAQQAYFRSGKTRSYEFRVGQLQALQKTIKRNEQRMLDALQQDFGKSHFEGYATEVGFVLDDLRHCLKHLDEWMSPESVKTPLVHQPAQSWVSYEPYGVSLIIAPWNYPLQLAFAPLIGAIAAGNCALIKPSELTPHCSRLIAEMVRETFDPQYVTVVQGAVAETTALLEQPFNHIFFTGSVRVGKIVMEAAAKHLTPVVLELGGKSPCIVDRGVDLALTARRIVWGKFLNGGQTCVAPDYVLVPTELRQELVDHLRSAIHEFYGADPQQSADFPRMISEQHYERLVGLIQSEKLAIGGQHVRAERYIAPTVMVNVDWNDPVMQEEIFGPILPLLDYETLDAAISQVQDQPRPLALYLFSENPAHQDLVSSQISFGGGCINDTLIHCANPNLPFGGNGSSGMGAYHGRYSFEAFSHRKALMQRPLGMDLPVRYPPYSKLKGALLRKLLR